MKTKEEKVEKCKKVFTKEERNIIINKDYNPLKVNYKIYKRGSGLFMKNETLNRVKKIGKKYNKSENVTKLLLKICLDFKISDYEKIIEKFLMK